MLACNRMRLSYFVAAATISVAFSLTSCTSRTAGVSVPEVPSGARWNVEMSASDKQEFAKGLLNVMIVSKQDLELRELEAETGVRPSSSKYKTQVRLPGGDECYLEAVDPVSPARAHKEWTCAAQFSTDSEAELAYKRILKLLQDTVGRRPTVSQAVEENIRTVWFQSPTKADASVVAHLTRDRKVIIAVQPALQLWFRDQ